MEPLLSLTVTEPAFRELREAYDQAFRQFVLAINAHGDVERATAKYRETRDELAAFLLSRRSEQAHAEMTACCCRA